MASLSRHQRVVIALSVRILRAGVAGTSQRRVDTIEVRLALRCLLPHCPERWPLELYWDAAAQEKEIGRAQGTTATFNGIVRQLRRAGRYEEATGDLIGRNARTGGDADADGPPGVVHDEEVRRPAGT